MGRGGGSSLGPTPTPNPSFPQNVCGNFDKHYIQVYISFRVTIKSFTYEYSLPVQFYVLCDMPCNFLKALVYKT